ncbi:probable N-acetyltransferase HLS1 [Dendrobium catenatum]|uniref:N-acetyltransferase domain-containing protein n=1 Tax=Dendrobium catenatum TaxID=906689 RepID=A0A2I0V7T3_9ASPA|nr:probable N-acetyltransferase HLS1 [Dendrobium catenatum]PKU59469.1 hypothetical protein MA16_Dca012798 [Dendrobium catenatum]
MGGTEQEKMVIVVREYEEEKDREGAELVDRICEVGPSGAVSLFTDLLGDPVCRVRHFPAFLMLVAETTSPEREIVGLIRGCVKSVTCGDKGPRRGGGGAVPIYTKAAYILGLRVSPSHRRLGIGLKLVQRMEEWFVSKGAEYSYMATDNDNKASLRLFTDRLHYSKFRTPSILVHPVFAGHRLPLPRTVTLVRLSPSDAESLYRRRFSTIEFFPRDIDAILHNPLSLGTFLALPSGAAFSGIESFLADPPTSWAVLSVWDSKSLFRLEIRGASLLLRGLAWTSRAVDRALPWLKIPSFPNLFRPFGGYFLYGLGGEGPTAKELLRALCLHAHNMARAGGCSVVATEVAACEPLIDGIPHWKRLSCAEDLWCIKRLAEDYSDGAVGDWSRSPPGSSMFVDPREV